MTDKQRQFLGLTSEGMDEIAAYKSVYSVSKLTDEKIQLRARELLEKLKISLKSDIMEEDLPPPQFLKLNYADYCSMVHGDFWIKTRVSQFLCNEIERFIETDTKNPYDILILSMPPQHGKSMTITETLPSYYLCKNPQGRVIEISYNEELAMLFGRRNQHKLSEYGAAMGVALAKTPNRSREFELDNNLGGMISRGVMSGITGRACNLMIIDDPIKNRREADSPRYRQRLFDEWENSFKTRLSAGAKVILIQTRWHEDDLAGSLMTSEKNTTIINLPCEAEENDPMGRAVGAPLAPEIGKDEEWLVSFKESYLTGNGTRAWNSLFQGHPTPSEGNIFKREWWSFYTSLPPPEYMLLSVDAAFKSGIKNDFVVIQLWARNEGNFYLVDMLRGHLDFPATLSAIRTISEGRKLNLILIEDKANGSAIIQMLKREFSYVLGVNPLGGKEARANAITGVVESGRVFLPKFASFTGAFIEECTAFPMGKYDDQVDAMTQALNRMVYGSGAKASKVSQGDLLAVFSVAGGKKDLLGKGDKENVL